MKLNEYQDLANTFACYDHFDYPMNNLVSEVGELFGKIAKAQRGDSPFDQKGFKAELGDILWCLSESCRQRGWTLEEVGQENIEKLTDRKARGVIKGNGDDR